MLVYSITDYKSYEIISHLHQHVCRVHPENRVPVIIVGNKADLLHAKQVEPHHGLQLANVLGCTYYEVSASENYNDVYNAFHVLCKEISKQQMSSNAEKRKTSIIARPKSPNMLDLRRRFKQALSAKVRTATSVWTDSWKSFGHGFVKHEIKMSTKFWKTKVIPRNWRRVQNRLPLYSLAWTVDHCQVVVLKMGMSDCGSRQTIWSLLLGSLLDALQGLFVQLF